MLIQQFHREFKIALDKVDSSAYPEFQSGEIDYYLNEAQDRFIKQRYGYNNIYRSGFEQLQKRTDDLKNLVVTRYASVSEVPHYKSAGYNVFKANISDLYNDLELESQATETYMLFIKALANTCADECCEWGKVKLVQQDDFSTLEKDPFNKPKLDKPIMFFEEGNIFIWAASGAVIDNFLVTFIKRPAQMNLGTYNGPAVQCELSEYTHKEIIQMAVGIALENIESQRQQSQEILNTQKVE